MKNQKTLYIGLDTGVGLVSHAMTSRHTHFAFLSVVETPTTPPTVGAHKYQPTKRPLRKSAHRGARSTTTQHQ